jgi:hypothetical protein
VEGGQGFEVPEQRLCGFHLAGTADQGGEQFDEIAAVGLFGDTAARMFARRQIR